MHTLYYLRCVFFLLHGPLSLSLFPLFPFHTHNNIKSLFVSSYLFSLSTSLTQTHTLTHKHTHIKPHATATLSQKPHTFQLLICAFHVLVANFQRSACLQSCCCCFCFCFCFYSSKFFKTKVDPKIETIPPICSRSCFTEFRGKLLRD